MSNLSLWFMGSMNEIFPILWCRLVTQLCLTLYDPLDYNTSGFPVLHCLLESAQTHVHWVNDAIQYLILWNPLIRKPSISPSIRVFSNESVLFIRWPKYWNFSISPSNEYSGLISPSILPRCYMEVKNVYKG